MKHRLAALMTTCIRDYCSTLIGDDQKILLEITR